MQLGIEVWWFLAVLTRMLCRTLVKVEVLFCGQRCSMSPVEVKSSFVVSQHGAQGEIRKLATQLSLERRLVRRMTEVLTKLRASERHMALDIMRRKYKNGGLRRSWLDSFLTTLNKLKA